LPMANRLGRLRCSKGWMPVGEVSLRVDLFHQQYVNTLKINYKLLCI